jgi:hypothetical protein
MYLYSFHSQRLRVYTLNEFVVYNIYTPLALRIRLYETAISIN